MKKKLINWKKLSLGFIPLIIFLTSLFSCSCMENQVAPTESAGIYISHKYPTYWSYNGQTILLLGGSVEDNLFQIPNLTEHLDLLVAAGGNYVRNTMSSRDTGNVWPFYQMENGLYDLNKWNDEYWERFERLLKETSERDIIVQIEVWATFDYYTDDFNRHNWGINPFNPINNINYCTMLSKLPEEVHTQPGDTDNDFFRTVPSQKANFRVIWFQQQFVDKILSYTFQYDNVLYCMNNETAVSSDWGKFWATYIQKQAKLAGKIVYTTDMFNPPNLNHAFHHCAFDNPDIFQFVDISQNNHQSFDTHWNNGIEQIERMRVMGNSRPVNNVKIYGHDDGLYKTTRDAIENFIKNILMGCASARFHRPPAGQGLNETAQAVIRSIRDLSSKMDFFEGKPDNDILMSREKGEAYCRAVPGMEYAVYFPDGGFVELDLSRFRSTPELKWLDVLSSKWHAPVKLERGIVKLESPDKGHWVALIK